MPTFDLKARSRYWLLLLAILRLGEPTFSLYHSSWHRFARSVSFQQSWFVIRPSDGYLFFISYIRHKKYEWFLIMLHDSWALLYSWPYTIKQQHAMQGWQVRQDHPTSILQKCCHYYRNCDYRNAHSHTLPSLFQVCGFKSQFRWRGQHLADCLKIRRSWASPGTFMRLTEATPPLLLPLPGLEKKEGVEQKEKKV